jgi:hypothetical protein
MHRHRRRGGNVRNMDDGLLEPMAVEKLPAWALHERVRLLRRKPFASLPNGVLALGPLLLIAPGLKVGLGPLR